MGEIDETYTVGLPLPQRELSPNAHVHWRKRWKASKYAKSIMWGRLLERMGPERPTWPAALIHITWRTNHGGHVPDDDNVVASTKPFRDGIVHTGLVEDDRYIYIGSVNVEVVPGGQRGLWITLERCERRSNDE